MAAPHMVPEDGVGIYQNGWTQGPACCICAGSGTIYRNYFVEHNGQLGQTAENQIDCLASVAKHLGNSNQKYWAMQNGYCFPNVKGLAEIEQRLSTSSELQLDEVRKKLMVGVQSGTEVTLGDSSHRVTQVFCSALPVAYSDIKAENWDHFPRLILDATYELTFYVAMQNVLKTGCPKLYLTLVGGGVFGIDHPNGHRLWVGPLRHEACWVMFTRNSNRKLLGFITLPNRELESENVPREMIDELIEEFYCDTECQFVKIESIRNR